MLKFEDRAEISNTKVLDSGDLLVEAACARTGVQMYLGTEIGLTDARPVGVHRPESVVFNKDSLASYAGKPVTIEHPKKMICPDTWKDAAVGEVQGDVARDGETVRVTFRVRDQAAIRAIQDGKRQISMGYTSPISMQDGFAPDGTKFGAVQTGPIEINHLAIVDEARGGERLRIGDSADNWGISALSDAEAKEGLMADTLQNVVVMDRAYSVNDQGATAINILKDALKAAEGEQTSLADKIADKDKAIATKDAEIAALKKNLEDSKVTPAQLRDMAKRRDATAKKAKAMGMSEKDMEDMDEDEMKKAAVSKKMGDSAASFSAEQIDAAFAALSDTLPKSKELGKDLGDGIVDSKPGEFSDAALRAAGIKMKKEA